MQVEKLRAEQTDPFGVVFQGGIPVRHAADVGVQQDLPPISGYRREAPVLLQTALAGHPGVGLPPEGRGGVRVGLQKNISGLTVHPGLHALPQGGEQTLGSHHSGDAHGPGQNGGVGGLRTLLRQKSQNFFLIQLYRLAGGQVLRCQHHRILRQSGGPFAAGENIYQPPGDILHIRGPGLHVGVLHLREHLGKLQGGLLHRPLGVFPLLDTVPDGVQVVLILQHHLVDLKYLGALLTGLHQRLLIELLQLARCSFQGGGELDQLLGRVLRRTVGNRGRPFLKNVYGSGGYAWAGALSLQAQHGCFLPP